MLRGFGCENDVGFGNLAGALSGRLPGLECSDCELSECCRVLAAQSTKSALLGFQLELLSASPLFSRLPALGITCSLGVSISKDARQHYCHGCKWTWFNELQPAKVLRSCN